MPILLPQLVQSLTQEEFHDLDYQVMGIAFGIHNDLGRYLDEDVYENELLYRLQAEGIAARQQFPIMLQFDSYSATLFADLIVANSTVYELKSVVGIAPVHRAQALGYVFLTGTKHGKLLNFGAAKVESEFVSTRLTFAERRQFVVECDLWKDVGDFSGRLKTIVCDLAHDWGLFLECSLYRLAIVHFFGGLPKVCQRVELFLGQRRLGSHEVDLLDTDTLLAISSFSEKAHHAEHHFQRLLALSRKKFLQWINFYKQRIRFVTLVNSQ